MDNSRLDDVIATAEAKAAAQDIPNYREIVDELRGYLAGGNDIPSVLTHEDHGSVQQAQRALAIAEARLDRVLAIQFNVKITLQTLEHVETLVRSELVRAEEIPVKASGPVERRILDSHLPALSEVRKKLELMSTLCSDTQKRIGSIRKTVDLMSRLDDNLRWSQYRQPG